MNDSSTKEYKFKWCFRHIPFDTSDGTLDEVQRPETSFIFLLLGNGIFLVLFYNFSTKQRLSAVLREFQNSPACYFISYSTRLDIGQSYLWSWMIWGQFDNVPFCLFPLGVQISLSVLFINETFEEDLANKTSLAFMALQSKIEQNVSSLSFFCYYSLLLRKRLLSVT